MKYKNSDYAKALAEILSNDKKIDGKKLFNGLVKLLERQGKLKKAKDIINLARFSLAKKQGKKLVVLESARKLSASQRESLSKFIEKGDIVEEKINRELIAGIKIIIDNEKQLDQTIIKKINNLF
jgi:F0F1-type ATP synthase delta subunit